MAQRFTSTFPFSCVRQSFVLSFGVLDYFSGAYLDFVHKLGLNQTLGTNYSTTYIAPIGRLISGHKSEVLLYKLLNCGYGVTSSFFAGLLLRL